MANDFSELLVERIRERDSAALAEFVELRRHALLAFIERRLSPGLRGKVEATDVLQELSIKSLREIAQTELGGRDPFGWLCQLAEQCIIDSHRHFAAGKRERGREISGNVPAGEASQDFIALLAASMTSPSMAVVRDERQQRLHEVMATFSDDQREVLRLRYGEGLSTKEIATKLNKSDISTRVLLSRLVHRLQELLEPGEKG